MTEKSNIEQLSDELEALAKAKGEDLGTDERIEGAAEAAGVDVSGEGHTEPDGDEGDDNGDDGDGDGDDLGKSFSIETASGEKVKAYDATAILKSMSARLETVEGAATDESERREHLGKSMRLIADLLKAQDTQIQDLVSQVSALSREGRGRKTVLTITEKPELAKAIGGESADGIPAGEFMGKAMDAQKAGRITALDVSIAETALNRGSPVPAHIVNRVMATQ